MTRQVKFETLELIRGLAALYVFFHHAHLLPKQGFGYLLYFGQEAVIVFFLLSGFVISHSILRQRPNLFAFMKSRAVRIYPVFLIALLLSYLSAVIAANSFPPTKFATLIGNLFMLQDIAALKPGVWIDTYYGNSPLWSLSYEWWFYCVFALLGLHFTLSEKIQFAFATIISLSCSLLYIFNPSQPFLFGSYLLIWWSGVELSREYFKTGRLSLFTHRYLLAAMISLLALWLINSYLQISRAVYSASIGEYPLLLARHYGAAIVFLLTAISFCRLIARPVNSFFRPLLFFAPISYSIYAFHQPLLNISEHIFSQYPTSIHTAIALALTVALAYLFEIQIQPRISIRANRGQHARSSK